MTIQIQIKANQLIDPSLFPTLGTVLTQKGANFYGGGGEIEKKISDGKGKNSDEEK